jgi:hypothetical protein
MPYKWFFDAAEPFRMGQKSAGIALNRFFHAFSVMGGNGSLGVDLAGRLLLKTPEGGSL